MLYPVVVIQDSRLVLSTFSLLVAEISISSLNVLNDEFVGSNKWNRGEVAEECP